MFEDMIAEQIDAKLANEYSTLSDDDKIFVGYPFLLY